MPPVLDPSNTKVDGLAFLGLSLARKSSQGHPKSQTHQTVLDLNRVCDRDYQYLASTNDDGWLVGGGEPGPPTTYKLGAPDSAHVEIMRIGTYNRELGGMPLDEIIEKLKSAKVLIPEITVVPTAVVVNGNLPPELEIRFDMEPAYHDPEPDSDLPALPVNWQLRFLHNQLFRQFQYPARFCPGAFHSTIVRKAEFRSPQHCKDYFAMCESVVHEWRTELGPQPLSAPVTKNIQHVSCPKTIVKAGMLGSSPDYKSGLWLFTNRNNPTHLFEPNFLPPYDTPEKRAIIYDILSEEWDERTLSWVNAKPLPKPQILNKEVKSKEGVCGGVFDCSDVICGSIDPTYSADQA